MWLFFKNLFSQKQLAFAILDKKPFLILFIIFLLGPILNITNALIQTFGVAGS